MGFGQVGLGGWAGLVSGLGIVACLDLHLCCWLVDLGCVGGLRVVGRAGQVSGCGCIGWLGRMGLGWLVGLIGCGWVGLGGLAWVGCWFGWSGCR